MQNYVGAVVDVYGSGRYTIFDAIPRFGDFRNTRHGQLLTQLNLQSGIFFKIEKPRIISI